MTDKSRSAAEPASSSWVAAAGSLMRRVNSKSRSDGDRSEVECSGASPDSVILGVTLTDRAVDIAVSLNGKKN